MRGSVKEVRRGVWQIRWDALPGPERKQLSATVHGTKREAERVLREKLAEVESGFSGDNLMVQAFLERWLADYCQQHLKPSTFTSYEGMIKNHVLPSLGNTRLDKLQPIQLQQLYTVKLETLSPRSVQYIHVILRSAFNRAIKWGVLVHNPTDRVDAPSAKKRKATIWTAEQAFQFLSHIREHRMYAAYRLAITTGMRRGEILGLRWEDVGEDALRVRQSLVEVSGELIFSTPKTPSSIRTISLSEEDLASLRRQKVYQAEDKLSMGRHYQDSNLVFTTSPGTPFRPRNFTRQFKEIVRQTDLPEIRLHDLRHTHATMLLEAGEHPKVVQERLGHSQIAIVYDTYSHVLPSMQKEATRKIDELLKKFVKDS